MNRKRQSDTLERDRWSINIIDGCKSIGIIVSGTGKIIERVLKTSIFDILVS